MIRPALSEQVSKARIWFESCEKIHFFRSGVKNKPQETVCLGPRHQVHSPDSVQAKDVNHLGWQTRSSWRRSRKSKRRQLRSSADFLADLYCPPCSRRVLRKAAKKEKKAAKKEEKAWIEALQKLLGTSASLLVTSALLVVTRSY